MFTAVFLFVFAISNSFSQTTVTKTYVGPASISIDGCGTYCATLPGVSFSAADFTNGNCQITDVNVSITWAKTDGTCLAPLTGSSFHNETSFRIDGPTGNNVILVQPNSYTGNGSTSTTTTILDQAAPTVIGGIDPVSGTFRPNNGNLNTYNGTSAFGTWFLRAGDLGGGDPLCIVSYSVTITVSADNTAPVPDLVTLPNISAPCSVTSLTAPTATDNCSGTVTGTPDVTLPITASGTTVVTWTYTDGTGNSSTQTQNVIITDNIAPAADAASLADITAQCSVTSLTAPTATDNCGGVVTVTNDATLPITAQGTTVVTWTYTDPSGNSSTQTQNVIIDDNTAPIPTLATLANVTAECSVTSFTAPTATDNCPGLITVTNNATLPITTQGTTVVTWTYTDVNGNSSTQTQNVIIDDVSAPAPTLATLPNVNAECSVTSLTAPTATDNCGGLVTVTNDATLPITTQGTTVVTWTYTDVNGNSSTQTQNVVVDDVTGPVPSVASLANITAPCSVTSLTAPTATDNCGGLVTVTNDATLPITAQGTTVVTWTYTDVNGNSSTQTQNVVITDNIPPVPTAASLANVTAECSVTSLTAPSATDNCAGVVTVTNNASLPITTQGTTVVTWTYTDASGNSSTQAQNVILDDITAPVPTLATLVNVTAECSVTSLTAPTATDNCGGAVTVTNNASLPITTQGTTVVTWTYNDGNGNTATQTQNVILDDNTAPIPTVATLPNVTAECSVTSLTSPTATDNCGGLVTVTNNATLPITTQGTTVVTWTYTDVNGNSSTQTQNVILDDVTAPVADLASLANVTAPCSVTSLTAPTATDNCGGLVTVTNDATLPITAQGTTIVTWTYTDVNGNSSSQTQNVIITDNIPPVADAASLANITAECSVTSLTAPTATDNCGGLVTVSNNATLPITVQGTTVVTWTYTDPSGNSSTQTQNVILDDNTAPVPALATLANVTAECSVTALTAPTATDNCGGVVTVTNNATLPITAQGTTVVTWTYTDPSGNSSTQTQNVILDDNTAPVPTVATLANVTAECSVTSLTAPTATDNCGGVVTVTNNATLPITAQGTTVVTWTYTDVNGNSSTQTQNVVLDDNTAPVPTLATLANVTAACSVTSLIAPTATDNCGGAVSVTNNATLPITAQGTTVVTWTYTDVNGNSSTQTQNVVITDNIPPVPTVASLANITAECSVTSLTAPTATDNCGGLVTVTNNATLPITAQGTTLVTWTYTDPSGNSSTQTQNVIIDDNTAPVPTLATLVNVTAECSVTSLTAPTATDNCGGLVTVTNNASLPITTQGTTVVTWTYSDVNGNSSTQTQNVILDDNTAPVPTIATLANVTAECSVSSLTAPSATDNCGGLVTVTNNATLPITAQGTTVVTWTYTDVNGNSSTQTQNVILDDNTAPVPTIASLANVTAECSVSSLTAPTATDNCGGVVIVTNNAALPITAQGTTIVTWTYTDANGNSSTQTQNVILDDNTAPVPTVATLANVSAECSVASLTAPTATDNCGGVVSVTNNAALPITAQGTTVVTWTYTDVNGNSSTQTQNVILDDNTAPVPTVASLVNVTAECSVTSLTAPTAIDNCGGVVTVTNNASLPITTQGTTLITWTYTDVNGNSSTQTQNVILDDNTAPVPTVATLADVTAECIVTSLTAPTATDNCGGVVSVTNNAALPITAQGTTVVTWTYTDVNGNSSTQLQNVVIDDVTAPVPTLATLANVTAECSVASLTAPTATDNCGGVITVTNNATLPITTQGTTVVTWTYTDVNGNSSTQTQNVILDDNTAPVPNLATLVNVTAECSVTSLTAPTATDNCGGAVTVTNNAALPIITQGTTVVTWTYTDANGNSSTQTQNIVLNDVSAPVADVATLSDVTTQCAVASLTAPTATDNCGGAVTVTNDATLPISALGTTVVTWTYTDVNGNSSTQTQNIVINELDPPSVSDATYCLGDINTVVTASGSSGTYEWYSDALLTDLIGTNATLDVQEILGSTSYFVIAVGVDNCISTVEEAVVTFNACDLLVPTAITPDKAPNNTWIIENIDILYPNSNIIIFDRLGNEVFKFNADASNPYNSNAWDGTLNGKKLPVASYYYIINYNDGSGDGMKGTISIIRN